MKTKTLFVCQNCGAQSPAWLGKCSSCNEWNTFVEEVPVLDAAARREFSSKTAAVRLSDVVLEGEERFTTTIEELDRVLGGGVVPGSVILVGGDPGIGKSTLSLQTAHRLSQKDCRVLYVSGEESVKQTKMRSERLVSGQGEKVYIVNEVNLETIFEHINKIKPQAVVIDSIQVVYHPEITSSPGSVSQVRECANMLTQLAKSKPFALFIIGHVTKEGAIAGPRVLEHLVDTVLYFEGERYSTYRVLRAIKNRFGSTNEIGVFEMTAAGLAEVKNPSEIFLSERPDNASGSVVVPIMEGTRSFLVEIQGLVARAGFGIARQKAQGFDANRLALLGAVLEKKLGLNLQDKDVFLNVVGGLKISDPAADLGVAMAVASALLDKKIDHDLIFIGEVGLSAEVRSASQISQRLNEAQKLGFKKAVIPRSNTRANESIKNIKMDIIPVENLKQALDKI